MGSETVALQLGPLCFLNCNGVHLFAGSTDVGVVANGAHCRGEHVEDFPCEWLLSRNTQTQGVGVRYHFDLLCCDREKRHSHHSGREKGRCYRPKWSHSRLLCDEEPGFRSFPTSAFGEWLCYPKRGGQSVTYPFTLPNGSSPSKSASFSPCLIGLFAWSMNCHTKGVLGMMLMMRGQFSIQHPEVSKLIILTGHVWISEFQICVTASSPRLLMCSSTNFLHLDFVTILSWTKFLAM